MCIWDSLIVRAALLIPKLVEHREIFREELHFRHEPTTYNRVVDLEAEGERQAKTIKAEADLVANKILALARAEAIQISGEAEAQAAKYYEVFKQNPELANFLFQRKALEGLLKENSTLILDPNTPPFNLRTQPDATKAAKP